MSVEPSSTYASSHLGTDATSMTTQGSTCPTSTTLTGALADTMRLDVANLSYQQLPFVLSELYFGAYNQGFKISNLPIVDGVQEESCTDRFEVVLRDLEKCPDWNHPSVIESLKEIAEHHAIELEEQTTSRIRPSPSMQRVYDLVMAKTEQACEGQKVSSDAQDR